MLDPFSRGTLVAMSTLCVVGAIAFAPVRARSSSDQSFPGRAFMAPSTAPALASVELAIRRDPFAGEPTLNANAASSPPVPATSASASAPAPQTDGGPLPSNLASSTIPAIPGDATTATVAGTPRVIAIVTGAHPYAMLDLAGDHEIKGLGDRVNGHPIVAIDIAGVSLAGGQRLAVAPADTAR